MIDDNSHNADVEGAEVTPTEEPSIVETVVEEVSSIDRGIAAWLKSLQNTPLSAHTGLWNFVQSRLPDLSKLINKEINS